MFTSRCTEKNVYLVYKEEKKKRKDVTSGMLFSCYVPRGTVLSVTQCERAMAMDL